LTTHPEKLDVLRLAAEDAEVSKREIVKGRVRIKVTSPEIDQVLTTELSGETLEVVRVQVDRLLDVGDKVPEPRDVAGVLIVPVFEEVAVVEKRLLLKEEIHIIRRSTKELLQVPVLLRQQQATVERLDSDGTSMPETTNPTTENDS